MVEQDTQNVPSGIDFATEVKADRLDTLWRFTLFPSLAMMFMSFTFVSLYGEEASAVLLLVVPFVLSIGSLLTYRFLRREAFQNAARVYALTISAGVTVALLDDSILVSHIAPFAYVIIVFVAGLMLRPSSIVWLAVGASLATIFTPFLVFGDFSYLGGYQMAAIALIALSAALAWQSTGELYAVTEWALMNYQRERRVNSDLFENRQQLERALNRSRALSEQLQATNDELEQAKQAAEMAKDFRGQFLANMSHELRTPLNAIIGFSDTMLQFPEMYNEEPLPDTYRRDLKQISSSGGQLLNVINDILDLARVDAGRLEIIMKPVDVRPVIDNVVGVAGGLVGAKPVELTLDIPDNISQVYADETRFRQVLMNLYSNAAKFTDEGMIVLSVKPVDDGVQFSLCDSGCGIAPDQLERIFEEFRQSGNRGRDPRAGSGLGLAISRQLLNLMGGRIWAESEPGKGSTFHFVLQKANGSTAPQIITNSDQAVEAARQATSVE